VSDDARRRSFDSHAELYDAARPAYPEPLVAAVLAHTRPGKILEIGAGTGKATAVFARHGVQLVALEPGANMAAVLRAHVAAYPHVRVVATTFEDWGGADGTYDLAFAAQAIHWIDPAVRYPKIALALAPRGFVAILRNEKAAFDRELRAELDTAYAGVLPREDVVDDPVGGACRVYTAELDASGLFEPVHVEQVAWTQCYTTREYLDLLATYSDHALLAPAERARLFAAVASVIDRRGGTLDCPYVSLALVAQRRSIV
jgi:SAM-dependent methyltransferase